MIIMRKNMRVLTETEQKAPVRYIVIVFVKVKVFALKVFCIDKEIIEEPFPGFPPALILVKYVVVSRILVKNPLAHKQRIR